MRGALVTKGERGPNRTETLVRGVLGAALGRYHGIKAHGNSVGPRPFPDLVRPVQVKVR